MSRHRIIIEYRMTDKATATFTNEIEEGEHVETFGARTASILKAFEDVMFPISLRPFMAPTVEGDGE